MCIHSFDTESPAASREWSTSVTMPDDRVERFELTVAPAEDDSSGVVLTIRNLSAGEDGLVPRYSAPSAAAAEAFAEDLLAEYAKPPTDEDALCEALGFGSGFFQRAEARHTEVVELRD